MDSSYLDWALADFSGYIAVDELYDGPFCVLSIVDNRRFKRIQYEVLEHSPTHADIRRFLLRFKAALDLRGLALAGITTDASPLYPTPIAEVFGAVPHQICQFHVIAELTKAVLKAVAKVRKTLLAGMPKLPRGRPSPVRPRGKRERKSGFRKKSRRSSTTGICSCSMNSRPRNAKNCGRSPADTRNFGRSER